MVSGHISRYFKEGYKLGVSCAKTQLSYMIAYKIIFLYVFGRKNVRMSCGVGIKFEEVGICKFFLFIGIFLWLFMFF